MATQPKTKTELATEAGYSTHYLSKILRNLKIHKFVKEIKGYYQLTDLGKRTTIDGIVFAIAENPELTVSNFDFENLTAIDWQIINNNEQFADNEVAARRLRPLAIAYLYAINKPPRINVDEMPTPTEEDDLILRAIQAFLSVIND